MPLQSRDPRYPLARVRSMLAGLPAAVGYRVVVRPLRYRRRPHLAAETDFEEKRITLQVPLPLRDFDSGVQYAARRLAGKGMRFRWRSERLTFRTPRQILRFLYCHEWMHWYLKERLGRKSSAETACDRFALRNYRRRRVIRADADAALRLRAGRSATRPRSSAARSRTRSRRTAGAARPGPASELTSGWARPSVSRGASERASPAASVKA